MRIQYSAVSISALFVNSMVNAYGGGSKLGPIMRISTNVVNTAGGSMIGQNLGAGKQNRMVKSSMCPSH